MRPPRRRVTLAGIIVVLAVIGAFAVVLWMLWLVRGEDSPLQDPPPESPISSPASPPPATPVATPAPTVSIVPTVVPGSVPDLIRYAPDRLANESLPLSDIARFADIDGWMNARGITGRSGPEWEAELDALALPDVLTARGTDPLWESTYGFGLTDIDQVLAVGQAPDYILIMRGDFDEESLQAAWAQSGYQAVRTQDYTIWSLFPGDAVDLSAPASRPALGNLNNVVLLEDGTLIATSRLSRLEETLRVVRGDAPSLAANPSIAALLRPGAGSEHLITAMIVKGTLLAEAPATPVAGTLPDIGPVVIAMTGTPPSTPIPELPMPAAGLVLAGIERPDSASAVPVLSLVVSYDSADEATLAMTRSRHSFHTDRSPVTGQPYAERFQLLDSRVVGTAQDRALLVIQLQPRDGLPDWLLMLEDRDLGFLMWPIEP